MAKWDAERRVLNHEHTRFWRYTLQDVTEPNLQRAVFPYDEVCRIDFDHKILPISPASDRFITDTTFRDGQQARPPFTVQQIVDLFDLLHRLSGPYGVVRQTEFFLYSDKDREAVERCREREYRFPEITGWIRANRERPETGPGDGPERNRDPDFGLGLPYLPEIEQTAEAGF